MNIVIFFLTLELYNFKPQMRKNLFLLLFGLLSFTGKSIGQTVNPCATVDMYEKYKQGNPKIAEFEQQLEKEIHAYINKKDVSKFGKKTSSVHSDTDYYDIPVVVHVIHDYGNELLPDNKIYNLIAEMNMFYSMQNNVSSVINAFKPYIGKAKFRFHLANKDPMGQPTKGITHRFNYLTYGGDDNAKFDQWPPSSYVNIWFIQRIGAQPKKGMIVAYATMPPTAAANPFRDGIISNYSFIDDATNTPGGTGGSIDHEMGHIFNLYHTFGKTNDPGTNKSGACTDDDEVDDTPPTDGNLGGCRLYDTICSANYFKIYNDIYGGDSLANYPDSANEQNIMNYADCKVMFTKGQVQRMRAALNNSVGGRSNLWDSTNLAFTGVNVPMQDLAPVNDFAVKSSISSSTNTYFTCPGSSLYFINKSWGDTVTDITWTFGSVATLPSVTASQTTVQKSLGNNALSSFSNAFTTPGWVPITIAATGNNTGTTTTSFNRSVFVADATGKPANDYVMEFNNIDTAKWPMFNYYNNEFKWKYANVGYYDNSSIEYTGFDSRGFSPTGNPWGDFDDFFSMPMDLTSYAGKQCNLNYFYSAASRTSVSFDVNDVLEIHYSTDGAKTWHKLDSVIKNRLINKGTLYSAYTPSSMSDWAPMSITVPAAARTNYTVFRFRYHPGVSINSAGNFDISGGSFTTSNNFYMDRIYFSEFPAIVNEVKLGNMDVKVVPNPTNGDAFVVIKDADNTLAKIIVTDITGKQVYATSQQIFGNQVTVEIPHKAISVAGIYMVQTITGNQAHTQKLVVY